MRVTRRSTRAGGGLSPARFVPGVAVGAALVVGSVGCAGPTPGHTGDAGAGGGDAAVTVSVHQSRSNVAGRQLSLAVTNQSESPIEVTAARFFSAQFVSDAVWPKDSTTIRPGVTADLPVDLPAADCSATDATPAVEISYRPVVDGDTAGKENEPADELHTVSLTPTDPLDQLAPLFAADCLGEAAAHIATIAATTAPRAVDEGGRSVAELDLTVTPTGARGSLTVLAVGGTTLFTQLDPATGAPVDSRAVDVAVAGTAPSTVVTLHLQPSRCDPHAVAEDKLGTVFSLEVSVDDGSGNPGGAQAGTLTVAAVNDVRAALYSFVDQACGW
jgi:hypothetical protein